MLDVEDEDALAGIGREVCVAGIDDGQLSACAGAHPADRAVQVGGREGTERRTRAEAVGQRRIDQHIEAVRLQDPVRGAGGVVAAAFVVEDGHILGRALAVAGDDLERVQRAVGRLVEHGRVLGDVEDLLLRDEDLVTAAVERTARLDDHEARAAIDARVLVDL